MNDKYISDEYLSIFLETYQKIGIIDSDICLNDIPENKYTLNDLNRLIFVYGKNIVKFYGIEDFLSRAFSTDLENLRTPYDFILQEISNIEDLLEMDINSIWTHNDRTDRFLERIEFVSKGVTYTTELVRPIGYEYYFPNAFYKNIQKILTIINNIIKNHNLKIPFFYVIEKEDDICALIRCFPEQMEHLRNNNLIGNVLPLSLLKSI
jgi:hypothetical protein